MNPREYNEIESWKTYLEGKWDSDNDWTMIQKYKKLLRFLKKNYPDASMAWKMLNEGEDIK